MRKWLCGWCERIAETRVGMPEGWFTLKDPGEIIVCSTGCMGLVYDELGTVSRKAADNWKAGR